MEKNEGPDMNPTDPMKKIRPMFSIIFKPFEDISIVSLGMMCLVPFSSIIFIRMILTIDIMVLFFDALCISIKMIKQFFYNH